ncbi:MAG TPA: hypothetical protein PK511_13690 [Chitinophagales bacterium]|nr:hypothetical protein [Chitinophagales bacterium]HNA58445.1 hypothetical protein [Chitinophagales bacterium]HNE47211.1 hypothetical protein [Chitinophagales bacterium]HNI55573.1 hypothetical protein [Chitinophagales bacterium]HNO29878.1 hypothetical protein [Chitinophagales bacterium]
MIYLLLSILTSVLIFVAFKLIAKNHVPVLQAIVINYTVCVIEGSFANGSLPDMRAVAAKPWFENTLLLGAMFISVFYVTALTVKHSGLAVASIANKLSLIIPVVAAYFLYDDHFSFLKIAGILLAMIAVVFTVYKPDTETHKHDFSYYFLPLVVLIGGGAIDTFTKWNQENLLAPEDFNVYLVMVFGTAAGFGWLIVIYRRLRFSEKISLRTIGHGLLLGIPNYGTMYFLLAVLNQPGWSSSVVFPVNNIAVVAVSCLVAMVLFKEKLSKLNLTGIALSMLAIFLIMQSM